MINTEPLFERVRVLKNRVLISLRALVNRRKIDREKSNELQIFEERFDTALRFVRGKIGHIFTLSMRTH